jgi:hypothetical protein
MQVGKSDSYCADRFRETRIKLRVHRVQRPMPIGTIAWKGHHEEVKQVGVQQKELNKVYLQNSMVYNNDHTSLSIGDALYTQVIVTQSHFPPRRYFTQ